MYPPLNLTTSPFSKPLLQIYIPAFMDTLFLSIENKICTVKTVYEIHEISFYKDTKANLTCFRIPIKDKKEQGFDEANFECGYEGYDMDNG